MKNCGQVNQPTVDNSSNCDDFLYSECIIMNRQSDLIKGVRGMTGNEYTLALENELRMVKSEYRNMRKIVDNLVTMFPEVGIGVYED